MHGISRAADHLSISSSLSSSTPPTQTDEVVGADDTGGGRESEGHRLPQNDNEQDSASSEVCTYDGSTGVISDPSIAANISCSSKADVIDSALSEMGQSQHELDQNGYASEGSTFPGSLPSVPQPSISTFFSNMTSNRRDREGHKSVDADVNSPVANVATPETTAGRRNVGAFFMHHMGTSSFDGWDNIMDQHEEITPPAVDNAELIDNEADINERIADLRANAPVAVVITTPTTRLAPVAETRPTRMNIMDVMLGILVLGSALYAVLVSLNRDSPSYEVPSQPPTFEQANQLDLTYLRKLLSPVSGSALDDQLTAQYRAFRWLWQNDPGEFSGQTTNPTLLIERYALVVLYFATNGLNWTVNGFMNASSVCGWLHVSCHDNGLVKSIHLDQYNLNGTIPPELSAFKKMEGLSLYGNHLWGTLPASLGNLSRLEHLNVANNVLLGGSIPITFSHLRRLQVLRLGGNSFTGKIPRDLFQIRNLEGISMPGNRLTGNIPEFAAGAKIEHLDIESNRLTGSVPDSVFSLSGLKVLHMHSNSLTGTISTMIGYLHELEEVDVLDNNLSGTLPTEIGLLQSLERLLVGLNDFEGTMPSELGSLSKMQSMNLAVGHLTGTLPSELAQLSNLEWLLVGANFLTGFLPVSLAALTKLVWLDISLTDIDGGNTIEVICNKTDLQTEVWADCLGPSPNLACPCCTVCCNHKAAKCSTDIAKECRAKSARFESKTGIYFDERRQTRCVCLDEGKSLSCSDGSCPTCNKDNTVCALNHNYGFAMNDIGVHHSWYVTFQYLIGRNATVTFEQSLSFTRQCLVTVNGEKCRDCQPSICEDGYSGYRVVCDNIPGVGIVDSCFGETHTGVLAIFEFLDSRHRSDSSCFPRINPHWGSHLGSGE